MTCDDVCEPLPLYSTSIYYLNHFVGTALGPLPIPQTYKHATANYVSHTSRVSYWIFCLGGEIDGAQSALENFADHTHF